MIVKKLREKKGWSQEQLAEFSGLSLRTIQRVEAGNRASMETLKSLAATLEVDMSKLTENVVVIDKESSEWKAEPWFIRIGLFGVNRRSQFFGLELALIVGATFAWFQNPGSIFVPMMFLFPYLNAKLLAYVDKKAHW